MVARHDFVIEKKGKFYKEIDLVNQNREPISLVGREVKCIIKESHATETILHTLTEANGGVIVLDDANGLIALFISSTDTDIQADVGVYDIIRLDPLNPTLDNERILEGKITYSKGVTE